MLNYKELDTRFSEIMSTFSEERLISWLAFDEQREMLESLLQEDTVTTYHNIKIAKLVDALETFQSEASGDSTYTLAA